MKTQQKSTSSNRPQSKIIINITLQALAETSLTKSHLAELISDKDVDSVFFNHTTSHTPFEIGAKAQQCNLKKLQRYLNWETLIPADLLLMWAESLPYKYSTVAKSELANVFSPTEIGSNSESVIKELSDVIGALASHKGDKIVRAEVREAVEALNGLLEVIND